MEDDIVSQLKAVGLHPIVVDENTTQADLDLGIAKALLAGAKTGLEVLQEVITDMKLADSMPGLPGLINEINEFLNPKV